MILSDTEARTLLNAQSGHPHQLLGMHPLGKGKGLVVRALIPGAKKVEVVPVHEKDKPVKNLKKVHPDGLFEITIPKMDRVYAYDLVVADAQGNTWRSRDPYSFLPTLSDLDLHLFGEGKDWTLFEKLGSHVRVIDGVSGVSFAVWAPNARRVSVVGVFNQWDGRRHMMRSLGTSGIWEIFIPDLKQGDLYKFEIVDAQGKLRLKTDPFGVFYEVAPKNAAIVWDIDTDHWLDEAWMKKRRGFNPYKSPMSIYEMHFGSWLKNANGSSPSYREAAGPLIDYLREMNFTHVEFLPVAEHAYYPSWGYQVTGFFAPTSRYGTPDEFKYLINALHDAGIGVLMDWVPAHFPKDDWALARFDGTALYEHDDPRQGEHQDWGTLIFNYGRNEVRNFLLANALFWLSKYHIDGLRVDAVASMLYLDYSRKQGEWVPNKFGGRENLDAVDFLREFNRLIHEQHPGTVTIAEESTAWPMVSRPTYLGGLGFSMKWNMGWMHDTLNYFKLDPVYRKFHQHNLTFAMVYHHQENFILPLSHDEVVHGKGSLLGRMPGDEWQRFANLRALLSYQFFFPGKQLLFMGGEIGQGSEWNENSQVDWTVLKQGSYHAGIKQLILDLNGLYRRCKALWEADYEQHGFEWIDSSDTDNSVLSFIRWDDAKVNPMVVILNLTPVIRQGYKLGLPQEGKWREVFNSDSEHYGGSNNGNGAGIMTESVEWHGQPCSALFTLPPLGVAAFQPEVLLDPA